MISAILSYVLSSLLFSGLINWVSTKFTVVFSVGFKSFAKFSVFRTLLYFATLVANVLFKPNVVITLLTFCQPVPLLFSSLKVKLFAT